jgi:6-pyruvoyltetrahydropterin/6-carboxytetrahydropterin synthase
VQDAQLERTVRVRATHRYDRRDWSPERNREVFGAVAEPHAHDYAVTVTVRGPIDEHGFLVDLPALDELLAREVGALDGGDLNAIVRDVRSGRLQPSTETLARWLWETLEGRVPGGARLVRVRVAESADLAAVYPA